MGDPGETAFACDAMLGGLARWLRVCGHEASFHPGIADWDLIRLARRENRVLLTCDTGIFKIGVIRDKIVPALLIPHGLRTLQQLAFVLEELKLPLREPRCMACGGTLERVSKESVRERAPVRTFHWVDQFFECTRCRRLFWRGTHWRRIARTLAEVRAASPSSPSAE